MIDLLLLILIFFFAPTLFFLLLSCIIIYFLNRTCWGGLFLFLDSFNFVLLIIISLFILGVIILREKSNRLIILSETLVLFCIFFFIPGNILLLYMYFELSIFPILVIILGYGSQIEKINSAYYLIFYASLCSFPFLFIYFNIPSFLIISYFDFSISWEIVFILRLRFIIKFPVYFLHLWLPKAHVEAPTTASILLAGLLLKLGTAGFLRILGSLNFLDTNIWILLSFLGIILASFCCIFQSDSKALAAYSSISHIRFLLIILVYFLSSLKIRSLVLMLGHGYTSTLIFFLIGEFYHIRGRRIVYYINGFILSRIFIRVVFSLVFLSNRGVPPSLSFFVEFLGISSVLTFSSLGFWVILIYFFVSFYYSLFLLTNSVIGRRLISFSLWNIGFSVPLVIIIFNIFWFSLFY